MAKRSRDPDCGMQRVEAKAFRNGGIAEAAGRIASCTTGLTDDGGRDSSFVRGSRDGISTYAMQGAAGEAVGG